MVVKFMNIFNYVIKRPYFIKETMETTFIRVTL